MKSGDIALQCSITAGNWFSPPLPPPPLPICLGNCMCCWQRWHSAGPHGQSAGLHATRHDGMALQNPYNQGVLPSLNTRTRHRCTCKDQGSGRPHPPTFNLCLVFCAAVQAACHPLPPSQSSLGSTGHSWPHQTKDCLRTKVGPGSPCSCPLASICTVFKQALHWMVPVDSQSQLRGFVA